MYMMIEAGNFVFDTYILTFLIAAILKHCDEVFVLTINCGVIIYRIAAIQLMT
jgi:hypothetical protein